MFTRTGDKGETSVPKGRIGKDSPLVNFLGDVDEANSFIGLAISRLPWDDMRADLEKVQLDLFALGEDWSTGSEKITMEKVKWLEERTVAYRKESGPVKLFVVPGGSEEASSLHVARAVVRRLERNAVKYSKELEIANKTTIVYLNRLSSMLFAMAIVANLRKGVRERYYDIGKYF
ncbi:MULTISPECIES: cob(I)yrinic acid a,c-diamide adenosyltransferase [Metallosphaera]|uniref:ATP:cob(I)alamin adenosyltransferase n=3 Tax=Metallosphaera TaxID=41980 RepID=A4YI27_METS5|nr:MULTISPECIES: cob(I)yrinic acid a,c-diamide adenosyltransferase [Metallosphaera]ABP96079.1 ATP:cob(I)alamin adenosyltransferase [Metallosphaera sedula DSM 5348]AIM28063.1 ATP:cob(I)alamin adenosyltransferase [Metallosphaera sedula]AKV74894.1 ATP--cobalamin adenosyltransferase [Metallosphaera sedula]AKV77131.1 ATP--cobalamin adenosyltransferase [Metallosphaera sedula]AKV79382.1 ATP--cobalamin adenosyltransferase [Metallosphaera sedula]